MKFKSILFILFIFSFTSYSQVTNDGIPISWQLNLDNDNIPAVNLPSFDIDRVRAEDEINDRKFDAPWRFGYMHSVDYGFEDGVWTTLENGDRIWRLLVKSDNALSLNFIFDDFYMPEGGYIFLYNNQKSDLLGAYDSRQNQDSGMLGTWLVEGESVWIEYFEPIDSYNQGRLHLAKATHGYRNAETFNEAKGLNDSGNCNLDVDCSIGDDWSDLKDHNKRSAGILLSGGSGFCSGALINNTENDGTPYFLTANHCYSNPASWAFRFGWISPNTVCATSANSSNGPTNMTISGASLRARDAGSDFALVEINQNIPAGWDRVYAGWDRSGNTPDFTVGIHHPSGDVMKVCRDNDQPIQAVNAGAQTWEITGLGSGWELGVTEPGSSGSPLFDPEGRIIGQLFGGAAACSGTVDNNAYDYYGRMDVSWNGGGSSSSRLSDWLDPNGSGTTDVGPFPSMTLLANDLGVQSITSPVTGNLSDNENISITIRNYGENDFSNFDISFQINGGDAIIENYSETISSTQTVQYTSNETFDFSSEGDYLIEVSLLINDDNTQNDSTSLTVTNIGGGDCPEEYELPIVWQDNFECYDPFAIDNIGGWIMYDEDGLETYNSLDMNFTNEGYTGTGMIFNYPLAENETGQNASAWNTYEGNQGLYFVAAVPPQFNPTAENNDWMISPEFTIDGISSPTLSFWAKSITDQYGLDRFRIGIGSSTNPNDFTIISSGNYEEAPTSWTQYEFDLSDYEGQTIRVGVHCVSDDSFVLQMDSFKVEGTLGIDEVYLNEIEYYYDQYSKELNINSNQILNKVEIYNILGQNILAEELNSSSIAIDLSAFGTSIYIVRVLGVNGNKVFKLQIN